MAKKKNNARKPTKNKKKAYPLTTSRSPSAVDTAAGELAALNFGSPVSPLLRLPLELREKIYAYLLDTQHARPPRPVKYHPWVQGGMLRFQATSPPYQICTAILRVNKQIHLESINTFHSSNLFVRLSLYNDDIYWAQSILEDVEIGFVCTNPDLVSKINRHALDVKIIQEKSRILRCQVIFPAHFLPRFLDFLQEMCDILPKWGKEHAIHLSLRHKYRTGPAATERLLLEPWRSLHGISNVVVSTGAVSAGYASSLQTSMMSRFNPERWLQSLVKMKEAGTEEFSKGHYNAAMDHYVKVIVLLESVFKTNHGKIMVSMSPRFNQAVNKLRYQCELNQAFCRMKGQKAPWEGVFTSYSRWNEVILAADNAVDLAEDNETHVVWGACAPWIPANDKSGYTAAERSKARYRRASIMMEVGEWGFACSDLKAALRDAPGDVTVISAFEKAKEKYDPAVRPGAALRRQGVHGW
ncbi:MAG: hypothetical protein Q9208_004011 [Pyrenodesmia sp. 3 TL-2023]